MKTRNKLFFILGIIIILVGIGIIIYPIATHIYSEHAQKVLMEEAKEEILKNILEANSQVTEAPTPTPVITAAPADPASAESGTEDITEPPVGPETVVADDDSDILGADIGEEEPIETADETLSSSRLAGQKCIGIITIDEINLVYAVVEGVKDANIGVAIGHFPDSVAIGAEGNCALAGHNGGHYSRYFKDIKKLKKGDKVILTDLNGFEYQYDVYESFICEPQDVYVVEDLGIKGKYLTMVTCTNGGTQRYIVRAKCTTEASLMKGVK
ncbi:MAG: class D sortase [Lachnospiraceae bacterium]|nr:class D sortase [Lachnospiraceae bacterium]MBO7633889.1 class D sortase [Lachnospiraceae bacterium]